MPENSLSRQESFIAAILGNPGLCTLVESLTWTLLLLHTKEPNGSVLLDISPPESDTTRPILRIWDAFELLTDVRTLDLAWLSRDHGHPLADSYPNGLFPAATSIRLSGVMHYSFAASILYNNPAKLECLNFDNLQQIGKGCDHFLYRRANQRVDHYQRPSTWNRKILEYGPFLPFGLAGPMQNLLGPLTGRCPNLRSLTLRKVGQKHRTEFTLEFSAKDIDIYHEFATFIDSAKATLQHVVFEQGERTDPRHPPPPGQMVVLGNRRPMDVRFMNILCSHLFQGHWACLETMVIRGVNRPPNWPFDDRYPPIRTARGVLPDPLTRGRVGMMDHIGLGDPLAGVIR